LAKKFTKHGPGVWTIPEQLWYTDGFNLLLHSLFSDGFIQLFGGKEIQNLLKILKLMKN